MKAEANCFPETGIRGRKPGGGGKTELGLGNRLIYPVITEETPYFQPIRKPYHTLLRMLKALELAGFKSFADRTRFA